MTRVIESLMDRKFGKLLVVSFNRREKGSTYWLCQCDCGRQKAIQAGHLKAGLITSCGCYKKPKVLFPIKEGSSFNSARNRCNNPNDPAYNNYGGRGIKFLLSSKQSMVDHIGFCPIGSMRYSLDRIDNDGNYEIGNIRWTSSKEQANNRRSNVKITYNNKTQSLNDWVKDSGIKRSTLAMRIRAGWNIDDVINTPINKNADK